MNGLMLCFISDEKNIKLSTYQREAPRRCSLRLAAGVGLFVFVFVVCEGARRAELKIAAAYKGVVFKCDRRSRDQETCWDIQ